MKTQTIHNLKELKNLAVDLVKSFKSPQVILLEGPLAVGKTQMIKHMASELGCPQKEIQSPTFSLINVYSKAKGISIYHADFYRLKTKQELEDTFFWDIFYEPAILFIEWPELIKKTTPLFMEQAFY